LNSNIPDTSESKFESAISYVLIAGVMISLCLEVIGMVAFYHAYGNLDLSESKEVFIRGRNFFHFLIELFQGGYTGEKALFLMTLGVTALILTPYIRVVLSVFFFLWEKDFKYALITTFVLVLLTISLVVY
jgi:uncharacterized membrane protein